MLKYTEGLVGLVAGNSSAPSSTAAITGDHITYSEMDIPPWTSNLQKGLNTNSLIRRPDAITELSDTLRNVHTPHFNFRDEYWNSAASGVKANLVMINGDLDPNTPLLGAQRSVSVPNA